MKNDPRAHQQQSTGLFTPFVRWRISPVLLALAEWEAGMVEHRGGDRYRVNSYGDEVMRRIQYTCTAVRLNADDWRISSFETRP